MDLTIGKITALAAADAVNPCALAVLTLVLIAILTYNPKNKKKVLFAGLLFSLSVYILYIIYGLIIIQFFKAFANSIESFRIYLYKCLAAIAVILGGLNIRDYFIYKPGCLGTEMPISMRPRVKKMIDKITSPIGAFFIGAFVTVFLLPCTIGPYLIASGLLSYLDFIKVIPWLLYYNIIFILPMVGITLIVYAGYSTVEKVSSWKEDNIRYLHLVAGLILMLLGIAMLIGWI